MINLPSAFARSVPPRRPFAFAAAVAMALALSAPAMAQMSEGDAFLRVERLENQLRQITGTIEQLEHRNRQLEQQIKRLQDEIDYRFQQQQGAAPPARQQSAAPPSSPPPPPPPPAPAAKSAGQPMPPAAAPAEPVAPPPSGRRSDVFDPSANPNAPGVPRALGGGGRLNPVDDPDVGAPGARASGEPIDLSNPAARTAGAPQQGSAAPPPPAPSANSAPLPPPPPRNVAATGAQPTSPPTQSPKDVFDLGYGYLLRKDYALAEQTLRDFLRDHPNDPQAADARYFLGESQYQRRGYRDAAESFLAVTTKYEGAAKAPEALLRLGQSLAALKEKEAACAALGEAARKYPRASNAVKQGVEREQKRIGC